MWSRTNNRANQQNHMSSNMRRVPRFHNRGATRVCQVLCFHNRVVASSAPGAMLLQLGRHPGHARCYVFTIGAAPRVRQVLCFHNRGALRHSLAEPTIEARMLPRLRIVRPRLVRRHKLSQRMCEAAIVLGATRTMTTQPATPQVVFESLRGSTSAPPRPAVSASPELARGYPGAS